MLAYINSPTKKHNSQPKNIAEYIKYLYIICALLSLYNTASAFNAFCDSPSFYKFICFGSYISALGLMLFNLLPYYYTEKKRIKLLQMNIYYQEK
jgi:hypothetical protein